MSKAERDYIRPYKRIALGDYVYHKSNVFGRVSALYGDVLTVSQTHKPMQLGYIGMRHPVFVCESKHIAHVEDISAYRMGCIRRVGLRRWLRQHAPKIHVIDMLDEKFLRECVVLSGGDPSEAIRGFMAIRCAAFLSLRKEGIQK